MTLRRRPLVASLAAAAVLGVGRASARTAVADHAGRMVDIPDASRVVAIGSSVTEIVYALGAGDRLIGADTTSMYPEPALQLPRVGYMRQISAEGVLSLRPTLIISTTAAGPPAAFDQLRTAGVATLVLPDDYDFDSVLRKIDGIGTALGRQDAARSLITASRAEMSSLADKLAQAAERPKVLSLLSVSQGPPQAAGRVTAADGIIRLAGGTNAITSYEGYRPITAEGALAQAPDVLMVSAQTLQALGGVDNLLAAASLALTPAGKARRVFALDALLLLGFGPRTPEAARHLAAFLHPELGLATAR
ncbi:hemin ABC transporter substrate-binding protein [Reyranella sp. CPCC 100927]|uniref:heme/hemin ABC transporter substrate-binding protein n=1 Tax=Reyranella sp. CPCC 100927 TaxID=2599616 RepID=UPI0011B7D9C9|nr:ABC transporter substrate-binding protein [Reyranella sp. CPCC 100927]TWT15317.1 ABC transporter substrate-binding protein [Reyranella sp. CPCC 100927]